MEFRIPILAVSALICMHTNNASAATSNVIFNATVDATCTLQVVSDGTMAVSTDLQNLSSKNGGASAGSVTLSTTGGVEVGVNPTVVATPPAGDSATTWTPEYSVSGAHTVALTTTPTTLTAAGTSNVTVHLTGTKSGSDRFTNGTYQAVVTVTCE